MMEKISWASYAFALATTIAIYYFFILLWYYRRDIYQKVNRLSGSNFNWPGVLKMLAVSKSQSQGSKYQDNDNTSAVVRERITTAIQNYAANSYIREEIIQGIQLILRQYPNLKNSSVHENINQRIITDCSKYCSIRLEENEVKSLWEQ